LTPEDIAAVFATVLDDVDDVGVDEDFFELGGSSFTALTLVARINAAAKATLRLRDVIRVPTPRGLAYLIESRAADPAASGGAR
jgi:acyl carrier protein